MLTRTHARALGIEEGQPVWPVPGRRGHHGADDAGGLTPVTDQDVRRGPARRTSFRVRAWSDAGAERGTGLELHVLVPRGPLVLGKVAQRRNLADLHVVHLVWAGGSGAAASVGISSSGPNGITPSPLRVGGVVPSIVPTPERPSAGPWVPGPHRFSGSW